MKRTSRQRLLLIRAEAVIVLSSLLVWLLTACNTNSRSTTLTVFAAASLTEAFTELAEAFERQHPEVDVQLNFAGSQQLAQQLSEDAPADLFASANQRQMAVAIAAGRIDPAAPQPFASNHMVVVAPADNPADITNLADLARPDVKLVLAAPAVPAGEYARQILTKASAVPWLGRAPGSFSAEAVLANVVSYEQNVRAVLTKVALGEADAGIVYASDVQGSDLTVIEVDDAVNVRAVYPLAPTVDTNQPELARAFARFLLSAEGQQILAAHGLQPPAEA